MATTDEKVAQSGTINTFLSQAGIPSTILSVLPLSSTVSPNTPLASLDNDSKNVLYTLYDLFNYYLDAAFQEEYEGKMPDDDRLTFITQYRNVIESKVISYAKTTKDVSSFLRNSPALQNVRERIQLDRPISQVREIGVSGTGVCPRCNSTSFVFSQDQTRSGDEQATVKARCGNCSYMT